MKSKKMQKKIEEIVSDTGMSVDDRLESVLGLSSQENDPETEILIYSALIDMLWQECNDHSRDLTMMQLYVLLAEAYDETENYRPMGTLADGVLRLMRDAQTPAEIYKETIPRLASAIGHSVYNHDLYEILLRYVRAVLKENPEDDSIKPHLTKLLKLHLLLEYDEWREMQWTKDFQDQLSRFFTAEELMRIIANPKIGHLNRDPVEYTREWEEIYYDVEAEIDRRFSFLPRQMGRCFRIWSAKRELLKEEYGIDWRSPAQMNPRVRFD